MAKRPIRQILLTDKSLDQVQTLCLILPFLSDEKPLRGINGMADWRLNGQISQHLVSHKIQGHIQEAVLIPMRERLGAKNLLMVGMGSKDQAQEMKHNHQTLDHVSALLNKSRISNFMYSFNPVLSAENQACWLAEYLKRSKDVPNAWTVLVDHKFINSCLQTLEEKFPGKVDCRIDAKVEKEDRSKPFTLR